MPTLLETQHALRAMLFAVPPSDLPRFAALPLDPGGVEVHRNNCRSALTRALAISYPAIQRLVGTAFFEGAASAFIDGCLPAGACLDDYGAPFAEFLQRFGPARGFAWLGDVARLEWAVSLALHAADTQRLDPWQLIGLDERKLSGLKFVPHPSLTLLELRYPADRIWRSVIERDEAAMPALDLTEGAVHLLIERDASDCVQVNRLEPGVWRFTRDLAAGAPLHLAVDVPGCDDPQSIAMFQAALAEHLAAGRFVA